MPAGTTEGEEFMVGDSLLDQDFTIRGCTMILLIGDDSGSRPFEMPLKRAECAQIPQKSGRILSRR